ncbi:MAG TPA: VCBS repeat-containing protein, partial [Nannocystaceae bacterium]|nr:VCBS repeat-containing protein [Nannocystaceae bacterium]
MTRRALRSFAVGGALVHASGCALPSTTLGRWKDDDGRPAGGEGQDSAAADDDEPGDASDGGDEGSDGAPGGAHQSCPAHAVEFVECPQSAEPPQDVWNASVEWTYGEGRSIAVGPLVGPLAQIDPGDDAPVEVVVVIGEPGGACVLERVPAFGAGERIGELEVECRVAPALGDVDADCIAEIVTVVPVDAGARLAAFEPDGHIDWIATGDLLDADPIGAVALHDLDADGRTEVLFAGTVYDHTGEAQWSFGDPSRGTDTPHAADLDGDGTL